MAKVIQLGDYIREVAFRKNLSDREVARRSRGEIAASYVGDIKKGEATNPTVEKLQALARGLGCSEDELFRVARGLPIEDVDDPVETELLEKFKRLSPERQHDILKLLDFFDTMDTTQYQSGQVAHTPVEGSIEPSEPHPMLSHPMAQPTQKKGGK
jgi:transcriptional regulator with XRE-family HTH domain